MGNPGTDQVTLQRIVTCESYVCKERGAPVSKSRGVGGQYGQGVRRGRLEGESQYLSVCRDQRVSAGGPVGGAWERDGCHVSYRGCIGSKNGKCAEMLRYLEGTISRA